LISERTNIISKAEPREIIFNMFNVVSNILRFICKRKTKACPQL